MEISYSVDMVRLKAKIPDGAIRYLEMLTENEPGCKQWTNSHYKSYFYNFQIEELGGSNGQYSYWIGYSHNMEKRNDKQSLVIEYNPNKCGWADGRSILNKLLKFYFRGSCDVVTVDIACDIPINIVDLTFDKKRLNIHKKFDYGGDNITHYFGNGDGRIKIYNKAREMGLEGTHLTRYEITKDIKANINQVAENGFKMDCTLAEVSCVDYVGELGADPTLMALMYAVQQGYPINQLSRVYKDKIRKALEDGNKKIPLCGSTMVSVVKQYFQHYKTII